MNEYRSTKECHVLGYRQRPRVCLARSNLVERERPGDDAVWIVGWRKSKRHAGTVVVVVVVVVVTVKRERERESVFQNDGRILPTILLLLLVTVSSTTSTPQT